MTALEILHYIEHHGRDLFINLYIVDNKVVGYYKTKVIKYQDFYDNTCSYLFPVEFIFIDGVIETTMFFGFVDKLFLLPNLNGTKVDTKLILIESSDGLYNKLFAKQSGVCSWGYINTKSFVCLIESLNYIGFPFMKIATNDSLSKKLSP